MNLIGKKVDGKYEILTSIGKGGMSEVFLARDNRLNQQWAVKVVQKNARNENNESVVQSALIEANLIKQFDHPSIVRIVDIIEDEDVFYIIEDFIEGKPFNKIIDEYGAQPQENVVKWGMQICEALEYLHTRKPPIIYRDMKPANVMLKPDGNVKIIDFGIAREYKDSSLSDTVNLGTKGYAAPEQFGGKGQTDARTDVYCLGATLYELVTGKNPMDEADGIVPIRRINPQLDPGLEAVIEKCTQLDPKDRYQTCAELLYALQHYRENGEAYRAKQKKKLAAFIAVSAACLVFLITGITGFVMRNYLNDREYNNCINPTETTDPQAIAESYEKAISIDPRRSDAYFKLIDYFESDAIFTEIDEENPDGFYERPFLEKVINRDRLTELSTSNVPFYEELLYRIGMLYWCFYVDDDGDNMSARMSAAKPYLDEIVDKIGNKNSDYYSQSQSYQLIAQFYSDYYNVVDSSATTYKNTTLDYQGLWNSLNELEKRIPNTQDTDITDNIAMEKVVIARMVYDAINNPSIAEGFISVDKTEEDLMNLLNQTAEDLETLEFDQNSSAGKIKADIIQKINKKTEG